MAANGFTASAKAAIDNAEDVYFSCAAGAVLFIAGAACLFFEVEKRIREKELFNAENYVMDEITVVIIADYLTLRISSLLRYPYTVICSYCDAKGEEHTFKSGDFKRMLLHL